MKLPEEVVASLKPGENLIAGYCRNRVGNGLLDFGLLVELDGYRSFHQTATTNICRRTAYADLLYLYLRSGRFETDIYRSYVYG